MYLLTQLTKKHLSSIHCVCFGWVTEQIEMGVASVISGGTYYDNWHNISSHIDNSRAYILITFIKTQLLINKIILKIDSIWSKIKPLHTKCTKYTYCYPYNYTNTHVQINIVFSNTISNYQNNINNYNKYIKIIIIIYYQLN